MGRGFNRAWRSTKWVVRRSLRWLRIFESQESREMRLRYEERLRDLKEEHRSLRARIEGLELEALKRLQRSAGTRADGILGPATVRAVRLAATRPRRSTR